MRKIILAFLALALVVVSCIPTHKVPAVPIQPIPMATTELQETYWKLTELMGKPVVMSEKTKKEIYIILKKEGNRVRGFSGCNTILGQYELKEGKRITFSGMASTMMACPDLAIESEFNKMLGVIDNYSINSNIMTLNKARMAPLARFEAVIK
jgi:heat shock protein HslJ